MQAPNKVYILPSQHNLQYDNGGEEYIRKDAILEWATEKIRPIANEKDDYYVGKRVAFKQGIEKILSL